MLKVAALSLAVLLLPTAEAAAKMKVSFTWGPTKACFDSKSPPFTISGVPARTKTLSFKMVDLNVPTYPHWGGTVRYTGQKKIPYGAFRYKGPCPPKPHVYQFTVKALNAAGQTIATATAKRRFPE